MLQAMIEDLKADSQRWDQERRAANSRGNGTFSGPLILALNLTNLQKATNNLVHMRLDKILDQLEKLRLTIQI